MTKSAGGHLIDGDGLTVEDFGLPDNLMMIHTLDLHGAERFQAKWRPVRVKKTRQIENSEPRFDSIETEKALDW